MELLESILNWGAPVLITIIVFGVVIWGVQRLIPGDSSTRMIKQLLNVTLVLLFMVVVVLLMPFAEPTKQQLLRLFGVVLTAVIALASTTFVSNAMAGLMLISIRSFRRGDFIHVGEHFGRVTEKGLLHTEIQSEDRDLVTLPNLYVMTQPVKVVRASGTLVSADVSIGYEVHRARVSDALKAAADSAELKGAFVQITGLGDFSVSYKVSGFLEDVGTLLSTRTQLRGKMLDSLHEAGIEIASPSIMSQRPLQEGQVIMPQRHILSTDEQGVETLMFDKAELVARIDKFEAQKATLENEIGTLCKEGGEHVERETAWRERQMKTLEAVIETLRRGAD